MEYIRNEGEGKQVMDTVLSTSPSEADKFVWVPGPIIVGGGPSGLAVAACLKEKSIPSVVLERAHCVASLWQLKTYDRLHLHLPKQFCELPLRPFPTSYPTYPNKQQFVDYLEAYAREFNIQPRFGETVVCAEFDGVMGFWRVRTVSREGVQREYLARWVVAATGENAEEVSPEFEGAAEFQGPMLHSTIYRRGDVYRGKRVLVVGCGNSGMEVCLDLCNHEALPILVVRDAVHVLPREMFGLSTFRIIMWLLKWFPVNVADRLLLFLSYFLFGNTAKLGLPRPRIGPLQLKTQSGKTPVMDVGTLQKIKSGYVKVRPGIKRFTEQGVEFIDGRFEEIDAVILATGFKSNVPSWLKDDKLFSSKNGLPMKPFPNGWKGERGLYAAGFTQRGLLGASSDAKNVAEDIERCWRADLKNAAAFSHPPMEQSP